VKIAGFNASIRSGAPYPIPGCKQIGHCAHIVNLTLGLAIGPLLAAQFVVNNSYVIVERFSAGLIIVSAFVALLVAVAAKRRQSVMAQV